MKVGSGFIYMDLFYDVNTLKLYVFLVEDAVTEDGEILVYFLADTLKGFQPPEKWVEAVRLTHKEKQQEAAR